MANERIAENLTRDQLLDLYYFMQLNRRLEERLVTLFRQNKIVGGVYSSLGQEAVSIGTSYALEPRDWIAPMIRNIGALLVKGFRPRDIFTQHMAKFTSPTQGKDGTSHFGDLKTRHVVSPISMLGDLIPVMTGVALAGRYLGHNIVAMTWIGDGGSSTGAFHEGMNFAATERAPFVLIVENNQWAYSTPVARQVPIKNLADRAAAYGVPSRIVDGNDVLAVYDASRLAVDECRAGRGPYLIEVKTMRMKGHAQHDPAEYVPQAMFDFWKQQDPIARFEAYLTEHKLWDAAKKSEIDARIDGELDADQRFAEQSPLPPPEIAEQGVYCNGCHIIEAEWRRSKKEVTPPASSGPVAWTVADFGALEASARPHLAPVSDPQGRAGGRTRSEVPPAKTPGPAPEAERDISKQAPLRVPFGRGPKDRSVELERRDQTTGRPPHQQSQRQHGHRPHKRRRR